MKMTFSNLLIIISLIFTLATIYYPNIYMFGINNDFLNQGIYHIYIIQFFTGTFLHGNFFHFLSNAIFIYIFGNMLELIIGKNKMIIFFIFTTFFVGVTLSLFSEGNTVGISGFATALIAYYTLELKSRKDPEYKGGITAIIILIGIGFIPGISLYGHLFGGIAGVIFYFLNKDYLQKKFIGEIDIEKS